MRRIESLFIVVFSLFLLISPLSLVQGGDSWPASQGNSQRSNYLEGVGNITYPAVKYSSDEDYFAGIPGPVMVIGNVNSDPFPEIVAVSEKTNSLYVFNHTLSLLWDFKLISPSLSKEKYSEWNKISSLTLGDINGDHIDEILFSMCMENSTLTTLRAFDGDGTELWEREIPGRITKQDIVIEDINKDGDNEIIVGASNIYILNGLGNILSTKELNFDEYTGVSEIASKDDKILVSVWHYSSEDLAHIDREQSYGTDRPLYSFFNLSLFEVDENLSFGMVWQHEMEMYISATIGRYHSFYVSPSFDVCYFLHHGGLTKINLSDGYTEEIEKWGIPSAYGSITDNRSFWVYLSSVFSLDAKNNSRIWTGGYTLSSSNVLNYILVFDVNADGRREVVTIKDGASIVFFNAENGSKILESKIFSKKGSASELLLHADTDNDGFDEIITTDPEGRIVIIDNGSPPKPQESGMSAELMAIGGITAIITASAVIWRWRKRKNEL